MMATVDKAAAAGVSTYQATIHLGADFLELYERKGGQTFQDYSAKVRRRMGREGSALPNGSFAIGTRDDVLVAIRAKGRVAPEGQDRLRSHISKRAQALRCSGKTVEPYL